MKLALPILQNTSSGLNACWRFEEANDPFMSSLGAGKVLANVGTQVGSTTGKFGNATLFTGTSTTGYLINNDLVGGPSWSISCWFYPVSSAFAGGYFPCIWQTLGSQSVYLVLWDDTIYTAGGWVYDTKTVANYGQKQAWQIGSWHHVVVTCSRNGLYFYWNGSLVASSTANFERPFTGIQVGSQTSPSIAVGNFSVDQLSVWSKVLSLSEVKRIYNSGNGIFI